jgi:hypothetical protein
MISLAMGTTWAFAQVTKNEMKHASDQSSATKLNSSLVIGGLPTSFILMHRNKIGHTVFSSWPFLTTLNNGREHM